MSAFPSPEPQRVPFDEVATRVDELVSYFEQHPDAEVRDRMAELLQCVDALHRSPLRRLIGLLESYGWDGGAWSSIPPLERAHGDPLVRRLLELYDLAPVEADPVVQREQAQQAVAQVRPYVESHGGDVTVVEVAGGVITVELSGHCRGCTASQATLRGLVEQALREHVDGFQRMEIVQLPEPVAPHPPPGKPLITLDQLLATLPKVGHKVGES